jgi:DNA ligase D-like protein (predicted polymerase)
MPSPFIEIEVETPTGLRTVKVTNPEKTYFSGLPEGQGRKLDLVEYYQAVGDGIVRALFERPTVLKRHPDGAEGEAIYQKRAPEHRPEWIETALVEFPSGRHAYELCPVDVAHVMWAANLGTLDFHPWPSRRGATELPDELRIDLDPQPGTGWVEVRQVAQCVKEVFDEIGYTSFVKTSGSKGLHVYARIKPAYTFLQVRRSALAIAREVERRMPDVATAAWWKEERGRRVFLDYNRMARDQTIAAAYSVRARPSATVSAPITWDEVPVCEIEDFTIVTMRERFAKLGDLHAAIDDVAHDLEPLLEMVERDERDRGLADAAYPPQFPKMEGEPKRVQPSRDKDRKKD